MSFTSRRAALVTSFNKEKVKFVVYRVKLLQWCTQYSTHVHGTGPTEGGEPFSFDTGVSNNQSKAIRDVWCKNKTLQTRFVQKGNKKLSACCTNSEKRFIMWAKLLLLARQWYHFTDIKQQHSKIKLNLCEYNKALWNQIKCEHLVF